MFKVVIVSLLLLLVGCAVVIDSEQVDVTVSPSFSADSKEAPAE